MIHSSQFKAILDTNVIYPIITRDILFWFAFYDLFTPKWSNHIFNEWKAVLIRKGVTELEAQNRIQKANLAFPNALVFNYEEIIDCLDLPDSNDRHVLAAAIKSNSDVIVTNNIKDFPVFYLNKYGIHLRSPDDFLTDLIDLNNLDAVKAFKEMVLNKKNPELNEYETLNQLRKNGSSNTADFLHALL